MKLWLLRPNPSLRDSESPWRENCDNTLGFVVRAKTETMARILASDDCVGDEGGKAWLHEKFSTCEQLTSDGDEGIVMVDFNTIG